MAPVGKGGLLRQEGDARAALQLQEAGVGLQRPGQHLHQGGLAAAVDADEADALALLDDEARGREKSVRLPKDSETEAPGAAS